MRKPEHESGEEDRRSPAEKAKERLADSAEGQLLDERRNHGEEGEVGGERTGMRRLPVHIRDPLLLPRRLREREQ